MSSDVRMELAHTIEPFVEGYDLNVADAILEKFTVTLKSAAPDCGHAGHFTRPDGERMGYYANREWVVSCPVPR